MYEVTTFCLDKRIKLLKMMVEIAYESFLAELVFSPNDPRLEIIDNFDPKWLEWLDDKIAYSIDQEERIALKDLRAIIDYYVKSLLYNCSKDFIL